MIGPDASLEVTILVKNAGNLSGKETVILYVSDEVGSVSRPVKQMKQFKKVFLNTNETRTDSFVLNAYDLMLVNQHG